MSDFYFKKYLKYKNKYLKLKGGAAMENTVLEDRIIDERPALEFTLTINFFWMTIRDDGEQDTEVLDIMIDDIQLKYRNIPNVKLNFWYDSEMDAPPLTYPGITVKNIRDSGFVLGGDSSTIPPYFKIDYVKNHILLEQMKNGTTDYVCVVDLDVPANYFLTDKAVKLIELFGYVLSKPSNKLAYENGFLMAKTKDYVTINAFEKMQESIYNISIDPDFQREPLRYKEQFVWNTYPSLNALYSFLNDTDKNLVYKDVDDGTVIDKNSIEIDDIYYINNSDRLFPGYIQLLIQPFDRDRERKLKKILTEEEMKRKGLQKFYNKIDVKQGNSHFAEFKKYLKLKR